MNRPGRHEIIAPWNYVSRAGACGRLCTNVRSSRIVHRMQRIHTLYSHARSLRARTCVAPQLWGADEEATQYVQYFDEGKLLGASIPGGFSMHTCRARRKMQSSCDMHAVPLPANICMHATLERPTKGTGTRSCSAVRLPNLRTDTWGLVRSQIDYMSK